MPDKQPSKLEEIETQWSMLRHAHQNSSSNSVAARQALVMRYSAAIRRFIRFMTLNEDEADDISQEAILRLLKGDFAGADPDQGRFRDFLRAALRNMVRNQWSKSTRQAKHHEKLARDFRDAHEDHEEADWISCWRNNLLEIAWIGLKDYQHKNEGNRAYTLLRLRVDHPDWSYQELVDHLAESGLEINITTMRQQMHRARTKFAKLILDEVIHGLDPATPAAIQTELITLGIYEQVKDALP